MALRIRKDGRILCANHHPAEDGDIYVDDGVHAWLVNYIGIEYGDALIGNYDEEKHEWFKLNDEEKKEWTEKLKELDVDEKIEDEKRRIRKERRTGALNVSKTKIIKED